MNREAIIQLSRDSHHRMSKDLQTVHGIHIGEPPISEEKHYENGLKILEHQAEEERRQLDANEQDRKNLEAMDEVERNYVLASRAMQARNGDFS